MSLPRLLLMFSLVLFGGIMILSLFKDKKETVAEQIVTIEDTTFDLTFDFEEEDEPEIEETEASQQVVIAENLNPYSPETIGKRRAEGIAEVNRVEEFFRKGRQKFPIVETVVYKSRVPWQKGRAAWLADYASHYKTSRHFIARSLNGKADYFKQDVSEGDRFNVINPEKDIEYLLVVDAQLCKMWFYYHDLDTDERTLVKTYNVGLGRIEEERESGLLTPLGKYSLGDKIAVYKPGKKGHYNGDRVEMIRVFGTRWVPFEEEISGCTEPAKGFGIHGLPWLPDSHGNLGENLASLGNYESDGCIRLATKDVEELFSIIITKPTTIEIVKNIAEAQLPGFEKP